MLPDLRLLIIATLSTFMVSVGVGLYASTRFAQDPLSVRAETHGTIEEAATSRFHNLPTPEQSREAALRSLNSDITASIKTSVPQESTSVLAPAVEPEKTAPATAAAVATALQADGANAEEAKAENAPVGEPQESKESTSKLAAAPAEPAPAAEKIDTVESIIAPEKIEHQPTAQDETRQSAPQPSSAARRRPPSVERSHATAARGRRNPPGLFEAPEFFPFPFSVREASPPRSESKGRFTFFDSRGPN